MSRIGKQQINIPAGVEVTLKDSLITVKGPKGELSQEVKGGVTFSLADGVLKFDCKGEDKQSKAYWGLYRSLVANMVQGVTEGFKKQLEIVGVGYRAAKKGNGITINIGYSHPVDFEAPKGITIDVLENNKIVVTGADKSIVGLTAAKIRDIRKPEPYKGKGIKYAGEIIRRKAGKAAGKAA